MKEREPVQGPTAADNDFSNEQLLGKHTNEPTGEAKRGGNFSGESSGDVVNEEREAEERAIRERDALGKVIENDTDALEGPGLEQKRHMSVGWSPTSKMMEGSIRIQQEADIEAKHRTGFQEMLGRKLTPDDNDAFKKYVASRENAGRLKEQLQSDSAT